MIPTPQLLMAGVIALGIASVGSYFYGRSDGRELAEREHLEANNKALKAAQAEAAKLRSEKAEMETAHAKRLLLIDESYLKEKQDADAQKARDIAAARAGVIRLRDPGGRCVPAAKPAGDVPPPDAGTGRAEAAGSTELSAEAAEFLLSESNRADALVAKFNRTAQALIACEELYK